VRLRLVLIFCFALYALPASAAPVLSFQPSSANPSVGSNFSLDILITGAVDVFGFDFDLGFDPAFFSALSITEGAFLSSAGDATAFFPGAIDNSAGTISFTGSSIFGAVPGITGNGVLATVTFNALAAVVGSPISIFNVTLLDSQLNTIAGVTTQGTTVTATAPPAPVPEPSTLLYVAAALVGVRRWTKRTSK
jgi:hypothetical protein